MNRYLEAAAAPERVDLRSFTERGIEREPTKHVGVQATGVERRGIQTERGNINREIEQRNAEREGTTGERGEVEEAIYERQQELAAPSGSPEDARERLQADRRDYAAAEEAAAQLEKELPADRMSLGERMLLFVARSAKSMFDRIAEKRSAWPA